MGQCFVPPPKLVRLKVDRRAAAFFVRALLSNTTLLRLSKLGIVTMWMILL